MIPIMVLLGFSLMRWLKQDFGEQTRPHELSLGDREAK